MHMKTKELGWKETEGIQNIGIEDSHGIEYSIKDKC
jgi:hypothetical protein